ncbi:MAG: GNAT family N-acetyltransferase [Simkaniaceae bacterium]|nr:GNAT family N-acetyltransferase [Simkaniaceae bacterium]
MRTLSKDFLTFTTTILFASQVCASVSSEMKSDIFSFDVPEYAKGCHTTLSGTSKTGLYWTAHDIQLADIPYHASAFANPTIMAGFATGQTRPADSTANRIADNWMPRFLKGSPHGGMTIFNTETSERIGHVVAGGGDGPGVSEIAYTLMEASWDGEGNPTIWGQGVMSSVIGSIVTEWAPEVRRLSGDDMPEAVRKAFTCFGGQRLNRFDATASPSNPGSWYILKKHGFVAAKTNVRGTEIIADFDGHDLTPIAFEEELMKLYSIETPLDEVLAKGVRYQVLGTDGSLFTVSHHSTYDCMKLHVEFNLQ